MNGEYVLPAPTRRWATPNSVVPFLTWPSRSAIELPSALPLHRERPGGRTGQGHEPQRHNGRCEAGRSKRHVPSQWRPARRGGGRAPAQRQAALNTTGAVNADETVTSADVDEENAEACEAEAAEINGRWMLNHNDGGFLLGFERRGRRSSGRARLGHDPSPASFLKIA